MQFNDSTYHFKITNPINKIQKSKSKSLQDLSYPRKHVSNLIFELISL